MAKAKKEKLAKRSNMKFRDNSTIMSGVSRPLYFRGDGANEIGHEERVWDENQYALSKWQRDLEIGHCFNWYTLTQEDKSYFKLMLTALNKAGIKVNTVRTLAKATIEPNKTSKLYCRMAEMGLILTFTEKKHIAKAIRKSIASVIAAEVPKTSEEVVIPTINIQDRINAKLNTTFREIEMNFDDFMENDFDMKNGIVGILHEFAPPANRTKDLIVKSERFANEFELALSGKDDDFTEAYSIYSKKHLKAMLNWWTETIQAINSYGIQKKQGRTARKKKAVPPEKIVQKLKYMREFAPLKISSIRPVEILRSSEIYTFNTKTRKLALYTVDKSCSVLDVKGNKILNYDPLVSVQKTLRKPEIQLKQFMALGKPASLKWFKAVKGVEIKVRPSLSIETVLLKANK